MMPIKRLLIVATTMLVASECYGLPTYEAKWPAVEIASEGAPWLRDSDDERLIWLLPPKSGRIKLRRAMPNAHENHALCPQLKSKLNNLNQTNAEFRDYVTYIESALRQLVQSRRLVQQDVAAIDAWQQRSVVNGELAQQWRSVEHYRSELRYSEAKLERCERYCREWQHHSTIALTMLTDANHGLKALAAAHSEPYKQFSQLRDAAEASQHNWQQQRNQMASYRQHIAELEQLLTRSYRRDALKAGGSIAVDYLPRHHKLLHRLRKAHPNLRFKLVPLTQLRLFARMVPATIDDYYLASLPAFLGFKAKNLPMAKAGEWQPSRPIAKLPKRLRGEFALSLHGACALLDEAYFSDRQLAIKRQRTKSRNDPRYAAVLQYHYPVLLPYKATLSFRYHEVYQALVADSGTAIMAEDIAQLLATDKLQQVIQLQADRAGEQNAEPLPPRFRDAVTSVIIHRLLAMMNIPTLTLAGQLNSPRTSLGKVQPSRFSAEPCLRPSCQTGGWLRLTDDLRKEALQRLKAIPPQVLSIGPNEPLLVPGITQFASWRIDGL